MQQHTTQIDGFLQLAPAVNGSVTTFVNTRGLVWSFDCRNSTPLFLMGMRPKLATTPPIYSRSCPDLPLLSPVECQSWDQPPSLLPRGSASGAVTQTVLKKTRGVAFCAGRGGTRLIRRVSPALRSPRRRWDTDGRGYLSRQQTCLAMQLDVIRYPFTICLMLQHRRRPPNLRSTAGRSATTVLRRSPCSKK